MLPVILQYWVGIMDLVKEFKELADAVKAALSDGRLTALEAVKIVRELVDVLVILMPVIIPFFFSAAVENEKTGNRDSDM